MNIIFFFIPFLIVSSLGIYQDVFAVETITGYDYFDVTNPDGSHTWSSHEPYILENGFYVPFINSGLQTQTDLATVILNSDGSYNFSGKFTDRIIVKYADISNLNSWTYPNILNNETPNVSWDGNSFTSSKVKAGVGHLDYKYILNNGEWKTQLEAKNLSGLTTKVFGFDQIIDLNSDTIMFNNIERNLDELNGTVFLKPWLDANKAKVLNLIDGIQFDFDLGYDNLYSIKIYDTGVNSSRIVFDYRTSTVLPPNETLIIDPEFGYTAGDSDNRSLYSTAVCATFNTDSVGETAVGSTGANCFLKYAFWNTTSIDDTATITNSSLIIQTVSNSNNPNIDIVALKNDPSTVTDSQNWNNIRNNATIYSFVNVTAVTYYDLDLGTTADTHATQHLSENYFAVGFRKNVELMENKYAGIHNTNSQLRLTYFVTPPPDRISNLNYVNLSTNSLDLIWSAPGLNGGVFQTYLLNFTTPYGNPQTFLANTTSLYYNVTGLTFGTQYSYRVTAATEGGFNATGNILNVTTSSNTWPVAPVLTNVTPHGSTTQLDLEWTAPVINNINGYRIERETPIATGWAILINNSTTTTLFYNNTGLSTNIIYNYRVYAMNGTGISQASNTYDMTTFHLPDAVTTLTAVADAFTAVELDWTPPTSYAPEITDYQINYTSPLGDPQTIIVHSPVITVPPYTVLNLAVGDSYSFRISAITVHGMNTTGNIANATTTTLYELGNLGNPDETNTNDFKIFFNQTNTNSTSILLDVTYPSSYTLSCNMFYKFARTNNTYTGLTETPITGYGDDTDNVESSFVFNGNNTEIISITCEDVLTGDSAKYIVTIQQFELLDQIANFRNGTYGTMGQIGGLDLITLIVVIIGMIGFNRVTPVAGVVFTCVTVGIFAWFEVIEAYQIMFPAFALIILLAYTRTRQTD